MLILPAIDLRGGQCVRLRQGDYNRETVFGSDPADMAHRWVDQGAAYLHLVDLDGAKQGKPVKGNPEIKSSYKGATYLFALAENKADFDKDPAKYAP